MNTILILKPLYLKDGKTVAIPGVENRRKPLKKKGKCTLESDAFFYVNTGEKILLRGRFTYRKLLKGIIRSYITPVFV